MTKAKRTRIQILGLVSLSLIVAAATYGFAGTNAVHSAGLLGVGYGVLSDVQVSRISYVLDEANPTSFTAVQFAVDQLDAAVTAGVSITRNGAVIWAEDCQLSGAFWTCSFDHSIDVLDADWLHVTELE